MGAPYSSHHLCLSCRVAVKIRPSEHGRRCPRCRAPMIDAGRCLAVPPKRDRDAWRALTAVLDAGLRFHSTCCQGCGPGFRPRSAADVRRRRILAWRNAIPLRQALTDLDL
ncbi:hypothetical protein [Nocardia sp. NPDC004415]